MSAFIVSKQTMDRAVFAMQSGDVYETSKGENESPTELGRMLYRLNAAAVGERYNENQWAEMPGPMDISDIHELYVHSIPLNETQLGKLKALQCLSYQCNEGDVVTTSSLFKRIERRIADITYNVISNMPGYVRAQWDS